MKKHRGDGTHICIGESRLSRPLVSFSHGSLGGYIIDALTPCITRFRGINHLVMRPPRGNRIIIRVAKFPCSPGNLEKLRGQAINIWVVSFRNKKYIEIVEYLHSDRRTINIYYIAYFLIINMHFFEMQLDRMHIFFLPHENRIEFLSRTNDISISKNETIQSITNVRQFRNNSFSIGDKIIALEIPRYASRRLSRGKIKIRHEGFHVDRYRRSYYVPRFVSTSVQGG